MGLAYPSFDCLDGICADEAIELFRLFYLRGNNNGLLCAQILTSFEF